MVQFKIKSTPALMMLCNMLEVIVFRPATCNAVVAGAALTMSVAA